MHSTEPRPPLKEPPAAPGVADDDLVAPASEDKRVRSLAVIDDAWRRMQRGGPAVGALPGAGDVFRAMPRRTRLRFLGDLAVMALVTIGMTLWLERGLRDFLFFTGFNAVYVLSLHVFGLYSFGEAREGALLYFFRILGAFVTAFLMVLPVALLPTLGRESGVHALLTFVAFALWRHAVEQRLALPPVRVVVAGAGGAASSFLREVRSHPDFEIVGVFDDDPAKSSVEGHPVAGPCDLIPRHAVDSSAQLMVVAVTHGKNARLVDSILACQYAGIAVMDMPSAYEMITGRLALEHCTPEWFAFSAHLFDKHSALSQRFKRAVDIVLATLGLVLTGPIIWLAAVAVRLETRGPGLYRQVRVGRFGQPFPIVKLRTMSSYAEALSGPVWAAGKNDPRVTRVGRVLRFLRLDELPQFWNVLVGDMSIVGPRPERPQFVKELSEVVPFYGLRHGVRPGITGWAQVRYPYGASAADALRKLEYDLFYVRHYTLLFDLRIMLRTVRVMVLGTGSA